MNDMSIRFLYGTLPGRGILKLIVYSGADRMVIRFLRSRWSRPIIPWYAWRHNVKMDRRQLRQYSTFRDFFARKRDMIRVDTIPEHLISPCDGWLRACPIETESSFSIKGTRYRLKDLLDDPILAKHYEGGTCLVFRLGASDYHHYCYIDDGYLWKNHYVPSALHSVKPITGENYPVYALNRRCWCLMVTRSFGPVIQTEIGALTVGGIVNRQENVRICRGDEKGHFELAGSSIVLLFEPDRVQLFSGIRRESENGREVRVRQGMWIGNCRNRPSALRQDGLMDAQR